MREAVAASNPGQSQGQRSNGSSVGASVTVADANGYTIHPFMLGVDTLGATDAYLVVNGVEYDYLDL